MTTQPTVSDERIAELILFCKQFHAKTYPAMADMVLALYELQSARKKGKPAVPPV